MPRWTATSGLSFVQVTSFNEWGEGTHIEPARPHTSSEGVRSEDYAPDGGDAYKRLTRDWAARAKRRCQAPTSNGAEREEHSTGGPDEL